MGKQFGNRTFQYSSIRSDVESKGFNKTKFVDMLHLDFQCVCVCHV